MKALMAFLLIASTPSVWAIETVCKHSVETGRDSVRTNSPVFSDSHDGEVYSAQRRSGGYQVRRHFQDHFAESELLWTSAERIYKLQASNDTLWLLTKSHLLAFEIETKTIRSRYATTTETVTRPPHRAHSFFIQDEMAYVAHGSLGVSQIDLNTGDIVKTSSFGMHQSNGHVSKATDILALSDREFLVLAESVTLSRMAPFAFNGLVKGQTTDLQATSWHEYNRAHAGVIAYARFKKFNDEILINNVGTFHRIKLEKLAQSDRSIIPRYHSLNETDRQVYRDLIGDFTVVDGRIVVCAQVVRVDRDSQNSSYSTETLRLQ